MKIITWKFRILNPNKAGLFLKVVFPGGGGQFDPSSYLKKNLSNFN